MPNCVSSRGRSRRSEKGTCIPYWNIYFFNASSLCDVICRSRDGGAAACRESHASRIKGAHGSVRELPHPSTRLPIRGESFLRSKRIPAKEDGIEPGDRHRLARVAQGNAVLKRHARRKNRSEDTNSHRPYHSGKISQKFTRFGEEISHKLEV